MDRPGPEAVQGPLHHDATIRGRTRGGGNELSLALDLRYASREHAIFGQPEVGVGLLPGGGGTERLPRTIGRDRALEAILTSDDYDADTAERWGWVTRALPDSELDAFVDAIVARLASFDRASLASAKAMINRRCCCRTRTLSKLTASLPARSPYQVSSPALRASRRLRTRSASTSRTGSGNTPASPTEVADDRPCTMEREQRLLPLVLFH